MIINFNGYRINPDHVTRFACIEEIGRGEKYKYAFYMWLADGQRLLVNLIESEDKIEPEKLNMTLDGHVEDFLQIYMDNHKNQDEQFLRRLYNDDQ